MAVLAAVLLAILLSANVSADGVGLYWECRGPYFTGGGAFQAEIDDEGNVLVPDAYDVVATAGHYVVGSMTGGGNLGEPCAQRDCDPSSPYAHCTEERNDHLKLYVESGDQYVQLCIQPQVYVAYRDQQCWPGEP